MVKILENNAKNGIELYFDKKPQDATINALKEHNFRWHSTKKCWYAKITEQVTTFVNNLQEEKIALENGKYCYYDEILENANYIIAIQKNEHYIIDFTPNCLDKKHIEYNIQICNKNTFERTFKVVKTQEEKDNIIKEYIKD